MTANLIFPVMGLTKIRLIVKQHYKWLVELIDAELMLEVTEDEFILDGPANRSAEHHEDYGT